MEAKTITLEGGIQQTYHKVTVDSVNDSLSENKKSAQLRQIVTKTYPGAKAHDSLSDGLFDSNDFGGGQSYEQNRVAFVSVPLTATKEQVEAKINGLIAQGKFPTLVRFYDLKPILSEDQKRAMTSGLSGMTIEQYKEKQAVRVEANGEKVPFIGPDDRSYEQYAVTKFHQDFMEDQDNRLATYHEANQSSDERVAAAPAQVGQPVTSF